MNDIIDNSNTIPSESGKTRAIIAHITLIGWIIAVVQNNNNEKDEFASFYIRQMLGLLIWMAASSILSIILIGFFMYIAGIVFWVMSVISASNNEKKTIPIIGDLFQDWFKGM